MLLASLLVIITCFRLREFETWYLQDLLPLSIQDNWWVIFFSSLCSKWILVCMHSNHIQNQSKVSAYPAEELRIQPVKWWSPWEGLLMHPNTGWLPILTRAKQMKSLERNERITLRQVTRIYHWFRSVQLHFIIPKLILSVHVIYQKCVFFISQIWIFGEMRESHNVSKIGLIFSALSKSACGGLVRQVRHFVQPWFQHWFR